ncbi:other/NAK protein kinase [Multifurca ochricompacta]|uniref:non-specific serine/threonine protein kinase n=1 Tax=Multifurca ochricompacta TaxID=376703 RepID=A0AAD4M7B4_9AGAM|nr:other/NAK protein kinase [Multifurca ochricompacta]
MDSFPSSFHHTFENIKFHAKDILSLISGCVCQQQTRLKINGRVFKIPKVLGEGGFSFVYLAQDETSGKEFALKKIRCPTGSEGVEEVMREVAAYRRFKHSNIIRLYVWQNVYLFLPLYKARFPASLQRGNLQDVINTYSQTGERFSERHLLRLFKGTCEAVRAMHTYRLAKSHTGSSPSSQSPPAPGSDDGHEDTEMFPHPEGDAESGYSYGPRSHTLDAATIPLVSKQRLGEDDEDPAQDDSGELKVMIADDGVTPILMDLGSCMKARIPIENRSQALLQQDIAAEHSTMAYRAPELFDVKTGTTLDEKVDIWSLGCVLFALAYLHSPFENTQTTEQGGSIAMAVLNARYKHPASNYSQGMKALIDTLLKVNPQERPDIHQVALLYMQPLLLLLTRNQVLNVVERLLHSA